MSTVISVENVSKLYRLGEIGTGSLAHDVNRWWHKVRGKEDPYLKIGQSNDRSTKGDSDYVYALKDVSFEVKQGEVLGIIGRNGAGKSTLLKILSRVTTPTSGEIKAKGRIASLLEVGTGFHPELSGRDNIFLNGAILGMRKTEIQSKFDEIVDFSGCERYIDTPVKRYSSGMYVRLAFAVAAHLEPEILIVDEVLAVGDAEFQKKCIGKMKDVAEHGRTVLFVSHNMPAIQRLCNTCILIEQGTIRATGEVDSVISNFIGVIDCTERILHFPLKDNEPCLTSLQLISESDSLRTDQPTTFRIEYYLPSKLSGLNLGIGIDSQTGVRVFGSAPSDTGLDTPCEAGSRSITVTIPPNTFLAKTYSLSVALWTSTSSYFYLKNIMNFSLAPGISGAYAVQNHREGDIQVSCTWREV